MILYYTLTEREPVPCRNVLDWDKWMQGADRRVALEVVGACEVSTVFTGLDHSFGMGPRPLVFETLVWHRERGVVFQKDASTWEEALKVHGEGLRYAGLNTN